MKALWTLQLAAAAAIARVAGNDENFVQELTERVRERCDEVLSYNSTLRFQVATAIQNAIEIYVHSIEKVKRYGVVRPKDAVQNILSKCQNQTDKVFHDALYDIFKGFRDLHTQYRFPAPRKCYSYFQPIHFSLLEDNQVTLSSFHADQRVLDVIDPTILAQLSIGDQLLLVNGQPWEDFVQWVANETQGATPSAVVRNGIDYLSVRSGDIFRLPFGNDMTFTLQSAQDGMEKNVTIPWTVYGSGYCLNNSMVPSAQEIEYQQDMDEKYPKNMQRELVRQFFDPPRSSNALFKMNDTASPIIKWTVLNLDDGFDIGIIRIYSFIDDERAVVSLVHSLLENELKQTSLLLVDVRDNPGGSLLLADALPQLFSATLIHPTSYQALVSPINQYLFLNATPPSDPWNQAYQNMSENTAIFTPLVSFTTLEHANALGQAYFNPVYLLTNAHCYSACDMFTATMKDWANVTVVGEDGSTGGGGANVISYTSLSRKYPSKFPKFPFSGKGLGQSISVAWRQAVRRDFSVLEDVGVQSDLQIRLNLDEFRDSINDGGDGILELLYYKKVGRIIKVNDF